MLQTQAISPLILFFLGWSLVCPGQNISDECGTPPVKSDWLKDYQQAPEQYSSRSGALLTIPLTIHILGNDHGQGYYDQRTLQDDICKLNQDFDQADIKFYIDKLNYIDNTEWYDHPQYREGREMMNFHNVSGTVNCYVVANPAGNCGYYSPSGNAIAMQKGCMGGNGSTFAHELGHFFSLPHTFLGWGGRDYDTDEPTPDFVGGHLVEQVDGSNCTSAADGFCDTGPDYLSYRWSCNANYKSEVVQLDPDSVQFRSDGRLFMSYSSGTNCRFLFSDEQISAMRANILDHRPSLLNNGVDFQWDNALTTDLNYPTADTPVQFDDFTLRWGEIEEADYYTVQASIFHSMSSSQEWIVEGDTSLRVKGNNYFRKGTQYYWKVSPFSLVNTCVNDEQIGSFFADDLTHTLNPSGGQTLDIFPNPASNEVKVRFSDERTTGKMELRTINGQLLNHWELNGPSSRTLNLADLPDGLYVLTLTTSEAIYSEKIIVQ